MYREHFEVPFIAATEKYYKTESERFLTENSVSDYLKRAEERLREEEDRIERYLNANTRKTASTHPRCIQQKLTLDIAHFKVRARTYSRTLGDYVGRLPKTPRL